MSFFDAEADPLLLNDPSSSLACRFNDEKYSDLTIKCNDEAFKVHRIVLASRCDFFELCCSGGFAVSMLCRWTLKNTDLLKQEQDSAVINMNMSDDGPVALENMLTYLYTLDLDHLEPLADDAAEEEKDTYYTRLLDLFILADKYALPQLSDLVMDALQTANRSHQSVATHIKSYLRIASLPSGVHGQVHLMRRLRHEITSLEIPWSTLFSAYRDDEPSDFGDEKRARHEKAAKSNQEIIELIAEDPAAALDLIGHLGEKLTVAKQIISLYYSPGDWSTASSASETDPDPDARSDSSHWTNSDDGEGSGDDLEEEG